MRRRRAPHSLFGGRTIAEVEPTIWSSTTPWNQDGGVLTEAHRFDTQPHLAIDFNGNLENISMMTSIGIFSSNSSVELSRELLRRIVWGSSETLRRCDFSIVYFSIILPFLLLVINCSFFFLTNSVINCSYTMRYVLDWYIVMNFLFSSRRYFWECW